MANCSNKLNSRVFGVELLISLLNNFLKTSLDYSNQALSELTPLLPMGSDERWIASANSSKKRELVELVIKYGFCLLALPFFLA